MKEPPLNKSVQARRLREAARAWVRACDEDDLNYPDPSPTLQACIDGNIELLTAALAYANAVGMDEVRRILKMQDKVLSPEPERWQCLHCGRDKFTRKCPHRCVGGFRKRKIKWRPIYGSPSASTASTEAA